LAVTGLAFPFPLTAFTRFNRMLNNKKFDVVIIGGSYAGLSSAMALGRALRNVLIIDSGFSLLLVKASMKNYTIKPTTTKEEISLETFGINY
jgi:hypothetical protein